MSDGKSRPARKAALTLTEAAQAQIHALLTGRTTAGAGLRLSTPQRGCSGLMYKLDYVEAPNPGDEEVVLGDNARLFIDAGSLLYLIGSTMDWEATDFSEGFTFSNPNEKGRCGCGESFTI